MAARMSSCCKLVEQHGNQPAGEQAMGLEEIVEVVLEPTSPWFGLKLSVIGFALALGCHP